MDLRRILIKVTLFFMPLILLLLVLEMYNRTYTTFSIKRKLLESKAESTTVLVLGSSHLQNSFNPEFCEFSSINLAFGGQPLAINYYLLKKYWKRLKKLKVVVVEISDHNFYRDLDADNWNGSIYDVLYEIEYPIERTFLKKHFLIAGNLKFFTNTLIDKMFTENQPILNQHAFIVNDFYSRFYYLKNDSVAIEKSFEMRHKFNDVKTVSKNFDYLRRITLLCKEQGVKLILVRTPLFRTYRGAIPEESSKLIDSLISIQQRDFLLLDYSASPIFFLEDFKNDDHLNSKGAKKFTLLLDGEIKKILNR